MFRLIRWQSLIGSFSIFFLNRGYDNPYWGYYDPYQGYYMKGTVILSLLRTVRKRVSVPTHEDQHRRVL